MAPHATIRARDPFLNIAEIEALLDEHYLPSFKENAVTLDLTRAIWLGPMTVCLLYSWFWELRQARKPIVVIPPEADTFAARFLSTSGFLHAIQRLGVDVTSGVASGLRTQHLGALAAFEAFSSEHACKQYLRDLTSEDQQALLLHFDQAPDLVASGHFGSVVLKELLENALVHGDGMNIHYAAFEAGSSPPRAPHSIYSRLSGEGYLEVCVADSGANNLLARLSRLLPPDFAPEGWTDSKTGVLDDAERTILWSLDYATTSNPDRRRDAIIELASERGPVTDPAHRAKQLATGLHTLNRLASAYRGQIVIRTSGRIGTLDYSEARELDPRPRIAFWRQGRRRRFAQLQGTIVLFRVPKTGSLRVVQSRTISKAPPAARFATPVYAICGARSLVAGASSGAIIAKIEDEVVLATRTRANQLRLICVVLDGLELESKAFGLLLQILAQIPRRGSHLLLLCPEPAVVDMAHKQWQTAFQEGAGPQHLERPPSFVVASRPSGPVALYGDDHAVGSTTCAENCLVLDGTPTQLHLREVITQVRVLWLREALADEAVRHDGHLFLIQSSYYVPRFYEVSALANLPRYRRTLALWLLAHLEAHAPAVIVSFADGLRPVIREAIALLGLGKKPEVLEFAPGKTERRTLIETIVAAGQSGAITIVVDVLATGKLVSRFLRTLPAKGRARVAAVVDVRSEQLPYLLVTRESGSEDVPVSAVLVDPVQPQDKRPHDVTADSIVIIDRTTNRPVRYPVPRAGRLSRESVEGKATEIDALAAGHFTFRQRHHTYFLALRPLFAHLAVDLQAWLRVEAHELDATLGVSLATTSIRVLDEDTGLFEIVEQALRDEDTRGPSPITREELARPRVQDQALDSLSAYWFILPAMDTGKTIRQALEYATGLGAKHIRASVVASRASPDILAFFQRLRTYQASEVRLGLGMSLPLDATSSDDCPGCRRIASLNIALGRTANAHLRLRKLLQATIDRLRAIDVHDPGSRLSEGTPSSEGLWTEARLQALYVRGAAGDVAARKELEEQLKDPGRVLSFVRGFGRCLEIYGLKPADEVLYGDDPFDSACRNWAATISVGSGDCDLYLRGFRALAPLTLRSALPELFARSLPSSAALEALAVDAMSDPSMYFDVVQDAVSSGRDSESLLYELRQFFVSPATDGVGVLESLYAHLSRSSPWSTELTRLKMEIRLSECTLERLHALVFRFWQDGFKEGQKLWDLAKEESGSILARLNMEQVDAHRAWRSLAEAVGTLLSSDRLLGQIPEGALLGPRPHVDAIASLERAVDDVRLLTTRMTALLSRIALRVHDAMSRLRALPKEGTPYDLAFGFEVSSDCPLVAMTEPDFQEMVLWLLENSKQWASRAEPELRFVFRGSGRWVEMVVDDGGHWTRSEGLEGGLKSIRLLTAQYGGQLELPKTADGRLRVLLPSWQTTRGIDDGLEAEEVANGAADVAEREGGK